MTDTEVTIDFCELDSIRLLIKKFFGLKTCPYDSSTFYIGRTTSSFVFRDLRMSMKEVKKLAERIQREYNEYKVYYHARTIRVYLRGKPKWLEGS